VADVFLSYARTDRARAKRVARFFESRGLSVWWDRDIAPGQSFDQVIERELARARSVVVLWSSAAVQSEWIRSEAEEAATRGVLFPVFLEPVELPLRFRRIQAADLAAWNGDPRDHTAQRLADAIQSSIGPQRAALPTGHVARRALERSQTISPVAEPRSTRPPLHLGWRSSPESSLAVRPVLLWGIAGAALLALALTALVRGPEPLESEISPTAEVEARPPLPLAPVRIAVGGAGQANLFIDDVFVASVDSRAWIGEYAVGRLLHVRLEAKRFRTIRSQITVRENQNVYYYTLDPDR